MPVVRPADAALFETHGSRFLSFVSPSKGSSQLCAWQLTVPANVRGVTHRPSREEVLLVLAGELQVTLDGTTQRCTQETLFSCPPTASSESTPDQTARPPGSRQPPAWKQSPPMAHT